MALSDNEIVGAVQAAGFPKASWNTAVAVALAESSGNPTATHVNSDGSTDYGLFQINSVHSDLLRVHNWQDPIDNARMALAISSHGVNWLPWTTYVSGAYRVYLPRAARASGNPAKPASGGAPQATGPSGTSPAGFLSGTGNFFQMITSADTWKRIGYVLAGGFLILFALSQVTKIDNKIVKAGEMAALV